MNFQESRGPARLKPRQRRSIGYLAARMLDHLPNEPNPSERWEITIEQVMSRFDASRGSVYELFHVLEALLLVTKVSKNTFRWWGVKNLTQTLVFLRLTGLLLGFDKEIMQTKEAVRMNLYQCLHVSHSIFNLGRHQGCIWDTSSRISSFQCWRTSTEAYINGLPKVHHALPRCRRTESNESRIRFKGYSRPRPSRRHSKVTGQTFV